MNKAEFIKISGGMYLDFVIHDFDMARFLMKRDPVEVFTFGHRHRPEYDGIDDIDSVLVTMKYDDGCIMNIEANRFCAYGYDQRVAVFGDQGQIESENRSDTSIVVSTVEGRTRPPIQYSFPQRYEQAYLGEMEAFLKVLDGAPLPITWEDVRSSY